MCKNWKNLNQKFPKFLIDKEMENSKISITNSQIRRIYPIIQSSNLIDLSCQFTMVDLPQGNNIGKNFLIKNKSVSKLCFLTIHLWFALNLSCSLFTEFIKWDYMDTPSEIPELWSFAIKRKVMTVHWVEKFCDRKLLTIWLKFHLWIRYLFTYLRLGFGWTILNIE
jgi:hypothetical protein